MSTTVEYEPIIGLEVHAQLLTESKIFCRCSTEFGAVQNTQVCPICLGMPGVLPVLNKQALEFAIRMGLATNCRINQHSIFARKNYFYPDLPKGYQISQFEEPICEGGYVEIEVDGALRKIGLIRIHLEEDAGKSVHAEVYVAENESLLDLNRCGVPLVEIVSEPDIRSAHEAYLYLSELRKIVQYLRICDGSMEKGSLRCDANVSVRPRGQKEYGISTEVKNMNSIRGVEKALEYEIERQTDILREGGHVVHETLLWDADQNVAVTMRSKESAPDYRYFPEPDLVPLEVNEQWIEEIRTGFPELPLKRKRRLVSEYGLPDYDAGVLTEDRGVADYFEECVRATKNAKLASNWVMGEVLRTLKDKKMEITQLSLGPKALAELINLIENGTISSSMAKTVFQEMLETSKPAKEVVAEKGLEQVTDTSEIENIVEQVLKDHPAEVEKYLSGKKQLFGFLVGQVMKATRGKANPKLVNEVLLTKLTK